MAGGRVKGITIEIDGDTKGLNSALKDVNSQTSKTSTELRDVNKLLKLDPGNTELIAQKQQLLGKAVQSTSEKLATLKSAQSQVEAQFKSDDIGVEQYRSFQREIIATEGQLSRFEAGAKGVDDALNGIDSSAARAESGFKEIKQSAGEADNSMQFAKGAQAVQVLNDVSEKASGLGTDLISTGMDFSNAQSLMQTSMGMTKSEADQAMTSVHAVFDSGLVDSVDEANQSVMTVKNSFQDLNGVDLTNMTLTLTAIAKHAGVDIEDATNAASQAMKGFGIDGKEATDVVAKGLQMGLDKNHDFLDTMNEYSPTFSDAGISAQGMLSILQTGMETGAFNTDKAADAVKEFNLRLTNGDLDEPIKKFSSSTQDMFNQFKNGQATASDVMQAVGTDLQGMPTEEAKGAVQGLGTQFEDLGQVSSASLLMATNSIVDTDGAAKKMSENTPGEKWQGAINKLKDSFSQLSDSLVPIVSKLADFASKIADAGQPTKTIIAVIGGLVVALTALAPVLVSIGMLISVFSKMGPVISAAKDAMAAFNVVMSANPFVAVAVVIAALVAALVYFFTQTTTGKKMWQEFVSWLKNLWNGIKDFFSGLWSGITQLFKSSVNAITQFLQPAFTATVNVIKALWNGIVTFFSDIWNAIKLVFTVVITAIAVLIGTYINIWKSIITTAMNTIKVIFSTMWNAIKDVIMAVWNFLSPFISTAINAISNVISTVWNAISSVTSTVWNAISGVIQTVWNGISSFISGVINAISSVISSVWNAISGVTSSVWNSISSVISSVWNGIQSGVSNAVNAVSSVISNIWNGIKSVTSSVWNGIKDAITGPMDAAKNMISGIINAIKGFFSFSITWPHIPLPHFSINPSGWQIGDLLKGKIPSLGINWHAKGGIFNKPTLFAGQGGMHGVGEAGPEAVVPLNAKTLAGIGAGIAANMDNLGQPQININVYADVTDSTIKKIGREVQSAMARTARNKNISMGGM
ncbi:putative phage tail tape measure protein [Weissella oryzae SG25]|uniref:Putative phage tail tape measure protein n=1 Tax=Weissella oryzae (strain DSM 25784 / JCM 18191 / LMG 30913 / SG25) TaxID=1329250 RepID=A0A069D3K7_WEIOS|nr:phage tail tape measure protein [Weissella oryzae]GAK31976.1 putative phage tail tape measure protein [Weissella oryzae SG25]